MKIFFNDVDTLIATNNKIGPWNKAQVYTQILSLRVQLHSIVQIYGMKENLDAGRDVLDFENNAKVMQDAEYMKKFVNNMKDLTAPIFNYNDEYCTGDMASDLTWKPQWSTFCATEFKSNHTHKDPACCKALQAVTEGGSLNGKMYFDLNARLVRPICKEVEYHGWL